MPDGSGKNTSEFGWALLLTTEGWVGPPPSINYWAPGGEGQWFMAAKFIPKIGKGFLDLEGSLSMAPFFSLDQVRWGHLRATCAIPFSDVAAGGAVVARRY